MKILTDLHCHTSACSHAYSTIGEYVEEAKSIGLELIAITDHGPDMADAPYPWHFMCMHVIPRCYKGIYVLRGAEANILDYDGGLDLDQGCLKRLDWVIASLHAVCIKPGTREQNTNAVIGAIKNEFVDVIGHIGNPHYEVDYDRITDAAATYNKIIEVNNHSFNPNSGRGGSAENCERVIRLCMEKNIRVTVSSDAHFAALLGRFDSAMELLEKAAFPEELILNTNAEKVLEYVDNKL